MSVRQNVFRQSLFRQSVFRQSVFRQNVRVPLDPIMMSSHFCTVNCLTRKVNSKLEKWSQKWRLIKLSLASFSVVLNEFLFGRSTLQSPFCLENEVARTFQRSENRELKQATFLSARTSTGSKPRRYRWRMMKSRTWKLNDCRCWFQTRTADAIIRHL